MVLKSHPVMQSSTTKKYFVYIHSHSASWILWWIEIRKKTKGSYEFHCPFMLLISRIYHHFSDIFFFLIWQCVEDILIGLLKGTSVYKHLQIKLSQFYCMLKWVTGKKSIWRKKQKKINIKYAKRSHALM